MKSKFARLSILLPVLLIFSNSPAQSHQFSHSYMVLKRLGVKNIDAALSAAEEKLKKNPEDMKALWIKAEALQFNGYPDQSRTTFVKLVQCATKQNASKKELASIYAEAGLLLAYTERQGAASRAITKALELKVEGPVVHLLKALKGWQDQRPDTESEYDQYMSLEHDVDGYIAKAHYLLVVGKRDDALKLLAAAEKKYPQSLFINFERAYIFLKCGEAEKAEQYADLSQKKLVFGGAIYGDIANQYKRSGKIDKQLESLRKQVQYFPASASFEALALVLQERGKVDEEGKVLDKARQLYPTVELFPDKKCKMLRMAGRWKEALAEAQFKIDHFPNDRHGYLNRGLCYEGLGEYKKAIADFEKAMGNSPKWRELINRARCYLALKNYQKTLDDANLWLSTHPGHMTATELKARAMIGLGNLKEALVETEKLLKVSANNPEYVILKGEILQKLGRSKEAAAELARAKNLHAVLESEEDSD